jgi:hypothetical protein
MFYNQNICFTAESLKALPMSFVTKFTENYNAETLKRMIIILYTPTELYFIHRKRYLCLKLQYTVNI